MPGSSPVAEPLKEIPINLRCHVLSIKRAILFFWSLWFSIVCASNVADGLKAIRVLPETWGFASGNYPLMVKVTGIYRTPTWAVAILFSGVVIWEGFGAFLFWHSFRQFSGLKGPGLASVHTAFAVSLALWATFVIADEIFVAYEIANLEGVHLGILTAQLITLLAVRLLPDE